MTQVADVVFAQKGRVRATLGDLPKCLPDLRIEGGRFSGYPEGVLIFTRHNALICRHRVRDASRFP